MIKPFSIKNLSFPERIFNYRLSPARIIENVCGIVSARFRMLRNTIELSSPKFKKSSVLCVYYIIF